MNSSRKPSARTTLPAALALLAFCLVMATVWLVQPKNVHASWQGRPLFSGNPAINNGQNCTECHGPDDGTAPITDVVLSISGPTNVNSGETNLYTAVLSGGPAAVGGLDVSVGNTEGALAAVDDVLQVVSGEVTHNVPQAFGADNTLTFSFEWTAPDYGATLTMYGAGVSGNNSETPLGDGVATSSLPITVNGPETTPTPMPTVAPANSVVLESIASGLTQPIDIQHAGDGRLFIVEQPGAIRIIDAGGSVLEADFLDIEGRVDDGANEMGLLGLAFHPDYATNGYFYVNYTVGSPRRTRISRFQVSDAPNTANADSETVLLEFGQPNANHNGGQIAFGSDGYLYIATGDGGGGGDPDLTGQDNSSMLGKILRIDVNQASANAPDCRGDAVSETHYSVPTDNPFSDGPGGNCDEIWATGLRNLWRFSFDALTNDMWIGDVGQGTTEEVNFQPASSSGGENYGWRCYEGGDVYSNDTYFQETCGDSTQYVFPVYPYARANGSCSVTGGIVYRGADYPSLYGQYIFADYCKADLWALRSGAAAGALDFTEFEIENDASLSSPSSFGTDSRGELYVASRGGTIYQIKTSDPPVTATPMPSPMPTSTPQPTPTSGGSVVIPDAASIAVDHDTGAPGSQFILSAMNLSPNESATIEVNGTEVGTLQTDSEGEIRFILTADELVRGAYFVRLSVGEDVVTAQLQIDDDAPLRETEEALQSFPVPSTIDAALEELLPFIIFPQ